MVTAPSHEPQQKPLGELERGERGTIVAIDDDAPIARRLRDLGFEEDLVVEVLHQSPVGRDPIAVRVGDMTVALRRIDASAVVVLPS